MEKACRICKDIVKEIVGYLCEECYNKRIKLNAKELKNQEEGKD